jgi:hypothetical protein
VVEEFAPWLDPGHPNPAKAGEMRWYVSDEYGKSQEVAGPEEVEIDGRMVKPQSRTFIPAGLKDNPFLSRGSSGFRLTEESVRRKPLGQTAFTPEIPIAIGSIPFSHMGARHSWKKITIGNCPDLPHKGHPVHSGHSTEYR